MNNNDLLNAIDYPVILLNDHKDILFANKFFLNYFSLSLNKVKNKNIFKCIEDKNLITAIKNFDNNVTDGNFDSSTSWNIKKLDNGNLLLTPKGNNFISDNSNSNFQVVIENMLEGAILIKVSKKKIIYANKEALKITGLNKSEILSFDINKLFKKGTLANEIIRSAMKEENNYKKLKDFEAEWCVNKSEKKQLLVSPATVKIDNEKIIILLIKDITSRIKLEAEKEELIVKLERANSELIKLSNMKDDFLAMASHDIRSPFHGILGYTDLLLSDGDLNDEQKNYIINIKKSIEVQLQYVTDLLDVIKLESGEIKLKTRIVNLESLLKGTAANYKILAKKKNIDIILICEKIDVNIDFSKIVQVLNNLISNAIKFTGEGGLIKITCFKKSKDLIEIHVIDNGIGIEEDKIASVFSRYSDVKRFGTKGEKGFGLGLTITKKIINLHDGEIGVNSKVNEGSDFFIILPANLDKPETYFD